MVALRGWLWLLLVVAVGATQDLTAQAAPGPGADGLGSARGCMRSRTGVVGTVAPVTAESHTFLGRFVGSFARYVPLWGPMRGEIQVGVGGGAPLTVALAVKQPVSYELLPEQTEDRLSPAQHRALFTAIKSALAEIQEAPGGRPLLVALRLEGRC